MWLRVILVAALLLTGSPALSWADARSEARTQVGFGIEVAQRGLWREALYRFERAVAIDPSYAPAHNNLAVAYEQLGLLDNAREAYERALTLDPRNTLIRQNRDLFQEIHDRPGAQDPSGISLREALGRHSGHHQIGDADAGPPRTVQCLFSDNRHRALPLLSQHREHPRRISSSFARGTALAETNAHQSVGSSRTASEQLIKNRH